MDRQNILFALISVAVAGIFAYIILFWTNHQRNESSFKHNQQETSKEQEVLVAAVNLPTGKTIQHKDVRWQVWPKEVLTPQLVLKSNRNLSDFLGAAIKQPINKGQPITDALVVQPDQRGFLASIVKLGMRAVSIEVDQATGVAGFVFPGDYVDILLTTNTNNDSEPKHSKTILSHILVLAIDQTTFRDQAEQAKLVKTVTLEVTPEEAEILMESKMQGILSLSLEGLVEEDKSQVPKTASTQK